MTTAFIQLAAAGVAAYGQYKQGQAQERQLKAQAAWQEYNARLAQRDKAEVRAAGQFKAEQHRKRARAFLARNRAMTGASGVSQIGSPLIVAEDNAAQFQLEEFNIRKGTAAGVQSLESQSILDMSKAKASRTAAKDAKTAGTIGAGTSILQGTSRAFS